MPVGLFLCWLVIYNVLLLLGLALLWPVAMVALWRVPKLRAGFWEKWGCRPQWQAFAGERPLWLHTVSVGEMNAMKPLLAVLLNNSDLPPVVLTTTTATGQQVAQQWQQRLAPTQQARLQVAYAPFEFAWSVWAFARWARPCLVVLCETELWPNWLGGFGRLANTPVMVLNGRLSARSFQGYRRWRWVLAPFLACITQVHAQTPTDAERFAALGVPADRVVVSGSIKYDGATPPALDAVAQLRQHFHWSEDDTPTLLVASTHAPEEQWLLAELPRLYAVYPHARVMIAPRHPERAEQVAQWIQDAGYEVHRRREDALSTLSDSPRPVIALLDTVGELRAAYGLATVSLMGGSFVAHGGQNPLESLACGVPMVCGPQTHNFRAMVDELVAEGLLTAVDTMPDAVDWVLQAWQNQESLLNSSSDSTQLTFAAQAEAFLQQKQGAVQRFYQAIEAQLTT